MKITEDMSIKIWHQFQWGSIVDIAKNVIDRMDNWTEEELQNALDCELIYNDDRWEIMKYYQSPEDCNWDDAFDDFYCELLGLIDDLKEGNCYHEDF